MHKEQTIDKTCTLNLSSMEVMIFIMKNEIFTHNITFTWIFINLFYT